MLIDLIILSYHKFVDEPSDYRFSRTYDQFGQDISKKIYDQIHIDDGRVCTIRACEIMRAENVRAKIFVCTSLIGEPGYCSWDDLRRLAKFHDIENHSHVHELHTGHNYNFQLHAISNAQSIIKKEIGKGPRYFIPPYNTFNEDTEKVCQQLGLTLIHGRINILNISK